MYQVVDCRAGCSLKTTWVQDRPKTANPAHAKERRGFLSGLSGNLSSLSLSHRANHALILSLRTVSLPHDLPPHPPPPAAPASGPAGRPPCAPDRLSASGCGAARGWLAAGGADRAAAPGARAGRAAAAGAGAAGGAATAGLAGAGHAAGAAACAGLGGGRGAGGAGAGGAAGHAS